MSDYKDQTNPNRLFVGNLPFSMDEEELRNIFAEYGEISDIKLLMDQESGRFKGMAFIEYADSKSANDAKEALHNKDFDGRQIRVDAAKPKRPGGGRQFGGKSAGGYGFKGGRHRR
jgi:RNA recognition motif-containing protein